ncbi:MAG: LptF/LptG family permease, partial [Bdellovibrionales bacterium]|nr:LptF/LptG family permease [Bdellovibrionales bacterium]
MFRGRTAAKYIFTEMVPPFLMGIFIFIFVILMFQSLRLTEYVIVHGASTIMILKILAYISVSFLTVALPMSLLFAILFT